MNSSHFLDELKESASAGISLNETKRIDIVISQFQKFWQANKGRRILYIFVLPSDIERINLSTTFGKLAEIEKQLGIANWFEFDMEGQYHIYTNDYSNDQECEFAEYSNCKKKYVFFFGHEGVDFWKDGVKKHKANRLYSYDDINRYREKAVISNISNVIENYEKFYLSQKTNVCKFFESKRYHDDIGDRSYSILLNRPENLMRDDLKNYLNDNVQGTFNIEYKLNSGNLVDIYTEQSGNELYIFEVKWLGKSICNGSKSRFTIYDSKQIKKGIIQTLEYVKEIFENMANAHLRQAYLVVFDARADRDKNCINICNYKNDQEALKTYEKLFDVLPIIALRNVHPA